MNHVLNSARAKSPLSKGDCLKDIAKNEISVEKQLKSDDKHINRLSVSLGFAVEPR